MKTKIRVLILCAASAMALLRPHAAAGNDGARVELIRVANERPSTPVWQTRRRADDPGILRSVLIEPERRVLGFGYSKKPEGIAITGVMENSPAQRAGVQAGDVILKIDGNNVADLTEPDVRRIFDGKETFVFVLRTREGVLRTVGITKQRWGDFAGRK
jgi:membrane-associated protease RseP (regulator of RpoE activity)